MPEITLGQALGLAGIAIVGIVAVGLLIVLVGLLIALNEGRKS